MFENKSIERLKKNTQLPIVQGETDAERMAKLLARAKHKREPQKSEISTYKRESIAKTRGGC